MKMWLLSYWTEREGDVFGRDRITVGGQSINAFDFAMAPYVAKSFKKALKRNFYTIYVATANLDYARSEIPPVKIKAEDIPGFLDMKYKEGPLSGGYGCIVTKKEAEYERWLNKAEDYLDSLDERLSKTLQLVVQETYFRACSDVEDETKQAMEAAIHNFNTLHSRAGAQVPFSSLNFGCDTSPEGRLVIDKLLDAEWEGLGHGETPIFPITVFQLKTGFNYNPGDPNYDLFQKACKVSAKRLFPNFVNEDATYNAQYYQPGNYNSLVSTMGCRTRVMGNVNGPEESGSRGNFSFVTINLPYLALTAKGDEKKFFNLLRKYVKMSKNYLEKRYEIIAHKHVYNFPFLMGQGVWMDSDKLKPTDEIASVLKHCSISIGFCGLAEALVALTGHHHGESEEAQELGLKIVGYIRKMTDKFTKETHMNWSTFGTPAESTAGQFARACQKKFGKVKGVCDREYLTNSSHVPVYYPIKAIDKIRIEAPYHALENAGHIAYIELDGDTTKNVKAFETVIRAMHDANMGYFSINHPVDRDPVCGYTGIIENECPHCHRREDGKMVFKMERIEEED